MEQLIEGQHLMIDCTAEMGVNHFLSEFARVRGLPYLIANATPGAWGGIVARFEPASPCWMCFRHALYGDSRSEEHTSELQSLMRISYAVFCLKKTKKK